MIKVSRSGSGPLTNGSGSRRPKNIRNIRILRIWIPNIADKTTKNITINDFIKIKWIYTQYFMKFFKRKVFRRSLAKLPSYEVLRENENKTARNFDWKTLLYEGFNQISQIKYYTKSEGNLVAIKFGQISLFELFQNSLDVPSRRVNVNSWPVW